jgi:ElaB/YqjD/DUF883 family membrane-anchored ribosome-binding protein
MDSDAEAIRQRMSATREALTEKLDKLEHKVEGTYCDAKERVQSVQQKYSDAKESVSNAVDVRRHVDRHPWAMVAGAAALGFASNAYFRHHHNGNGHNGHSRELEGNLLMYGSPSYPMRIVEREVPITEEKPPWMPPNAGMETSGKSAVGRHIESEAQQESEKPSRLGNLGETFRDEIQMLKGLALGTLFGIMRDIAVKSAPQSINQPLEEAINNITMKLGGQPIRGRVLPDRASYGEQRAGASMSMGSASSAEAMGTE